MKTILSERNIVVVLFVMVLITFSLAQEDSKKKLTQVYTGITAEPANRFLGNINTVQPEKTSSSSRSDNQ